MTDHHHLNVLLYGEPAGSIAPDERGRLAFRPSAAWRSLYPRPVLGQLFEDDSRSSFVGRKADELPPFFKNLVPEVAGELRPLLKSRLGIASDDDAEWLLALGRDLPGAITVEASSMSAPAPPGRSAVDDAVLPTLPTELDDNPLRFSLAGVQLKFSVTLADDRITLPVSRTLGDWLAKFDSLRFPGLCENEYATMRWATRAGFDVPQVRLIREPKLDEPMSSARQGDHPVLLVRRYDRTPGGPIHQEDFAQVRNLPPKHKYDHLTYEELTRLVHHIVSPEAAVELLRRFAFMIASGNGDAHLKNWSLIYPDRLSASLSPLYDQVATIAWPGLARELALKFASRKGFHTLEPGTLIELARRTGLSAQVVRDTFDETLERLASTWNELRDTEDDAWLPAHRAALLEHFQKTPLLQQSPLSRCTR